MTLSYQELFQQFLQPNIYRRNEIEDLQNVAIRERERYKESTQLMSDGISAIPMLPVNDSVCESVTKFIKSFS